MTMTLSPASSNDLISALEAAFVEASRPVEWLVITHNDPRIVSALSSALDGESAAVLELPQDQWNFEGLQLSEAMEWALRHNEIPNLILAGSSQAGGSQSRVSLVDGERFNGAQSSYSKLLSAVQCSVAQKRDAQSRFAAQAQQILQIPLLQSRLSSGELTVYPLFYRTDGGFFLAYDCKQDSFYPLLNKL